MSRQDTVKVLNNLIQLSQDGRLGFAAAAGQTLKPDLRTIFELRSAECEDDGVELKKLIESMGGTPKMSGTLAGTLRRRWADFRRRSGNAEGSMLEVMESSSDRAKAGYARALTASLPRQIQTVIQRQHDRTARNHVVVRDLRNSCRVAG